MEIMDFCQKVKKNLAEEIGEEMTLSVKQITKNNGWFFMALRYPKTE